MKANAAHGGKMEKRYWELKAEPRH